MDPVIPHVEEVIALFVVYQQWLELLSEGE